jgi:glycosyltransferase involved in cell wall biosynthesis
MSAGRCLLFVVNNPAFFMSHRVPVALAAQKAGYDVHVATMDGPAVADIQALGMTHHAIPMTRSGKHPLQELGTLLALVRLFRRLRPDVVHLVTIKPVLYGGIAARLARVPGMVAAISGLGFVFLSNSLKMRLVRAVVARLYRIALGHPNSRVIFQNANDRDLLKSLGAVRDEQVVIIRGAGVDLDAFRPTPEPPAPPVVVTMVARLLRDKGVQEFVQAARLLRERGVPVTMQLVGGLDAGNPASATQADVDAWQQDGCVQALGERSDVAALYAAAHIAVLPSYREGLPKSLIEAAACGRAVVTTDVPGCRDAIEPNVTGLLVPVRDAAALADAIARLAKDAALRQAMGAAGRALAEREFDINQVARIHVALYDALSA